LIGPLKDWLKRRWPALRLRTILFATLLFVAALPGVGAVFLRVYENTLVQQTEAELIAQGAALAGAYRALWPEPLPPPDGPLEPQRPSIDLNAMPLLAQQPDWQPTGKVAEEAARKAGLGVAPIARDTARTTLASIRIMDAQGVVVMGRGDLRQSYAHLPEVAAAMRGQTRTVLRRQGQYQLRYALELLSRAATVRVHYARPIEADGRVIGVLMLSRSPRGLFVGIYQDRGKIALGIGLIFMTLLLLAGLLSRGIAKPIEALSEALELLAEHPTMSDAERARFLANAGADADRLSHLLQRLLDLARADMAVAPEDSAAGIEPPLLAVADAHRGPAFDIEVAVPELPPVAAPAALIEAVVETLVENSRQAGASAVSIAALEEGARVRLVVSDNGPGVPAADHERIFEPFHTSRRSEGGSGLGLSIARSLLAACGGTIESKRVEQGARFELCLPVATAMGRGTT
jgi:signal transduction histidine kinase